MYVGPWQEYRLGQLFNEQTRLLADAVRQQIQEQIREEQSRATRPQVQLRGDVGGNKGRGQALSYSAALRLQSPHGGSSGGHGGSNASIASTDSTRSLHTPSSSISSQRTASYSGASSASQRHATASALSGTAAADAALPPLQAAARAAVHNLQANRVRVAQSHPLAHIVQSYLPASAVASAGASQLSSPALSDRSLSRQSSAASSASAAGASTAATAAPSQAYLGNPAHAYYRPPAHAIPRKAKKKPAERSSKEVAAAHREHLTKLRALYGLQAQQQQQKQQQEQQQQQQQEQNEHGHEQQQRWQSGSRPDSRFDSSSDPSAFPPLSPHDRAAHWRGSSRGGNTTPPPPAMHGGAAAASASDTRPLVLPPAVMPLMNAQTLALYGPIPDELAASLAFYARPPRGSQPAAAVAAAASRHQSSSGSGAPSPPPHPPPYPPEPDELRPDGRSLRSSHSRTGQRVDTAGSRPISRGNPPLLHPLPHAPSLASFNYAASPPSHTSSASRLHHLPASSASALSPSASSSQMRAGGVSPGQKMSMEARMRQEHLRQAAAAATTAAEGGSYSRSRTPSRLPTPLHPHSSLSVARGQLRSSSGMSDSGDFESELDDLLGWANELQA